jgi:Cu/Ag efflux protein CusF
MRKCSVTLNALLLALFVVAFGAVNQVAAQERQEKPDGQEKQMQGRVVSVDAARNQITIKDEQGADRPLQVSSATRISKDGKAIRLTEIKSGDQIHCMYEGTMDNPSVKTIVVAPSKSSTP